MSGTSPLRMSVVPASCNSGPACCTAWPVPSCGSWRTNCRPGALLAVSTSAAPCPVMAMMRSAPSAATLARLQGELAGPLTAAQVCRWNQDIEARLDTGFAQAVPSIADIARTLSPAQLAHLQRRFAKNNAEYRSEFLQPSLEERMRASFKRIVERTEVVYGRLDDVQRERIAQWTADSPFDAQAWYVERQRRQQEIAETLQRIGNEPLSADEAQRALRLLYEHMWRSPREGYRAYQERLLAYNC